MDTSRTDIFSLNNTPSTQKLTPTGNLETDLFNIRQHSKEEYERQKTENEIKKRQQEMQWKTQLQAQGFGEVSKPDRNDKNLKRNYLNSLSYQDQKKFIDLYNKNKDLDFGNVVERLEDESETARGGSLKAQINAQNERGFLDYGNLVGLATEEIDNLVQSIPTYTTDKRKQDLRDKVNSLPLSQKIQYLNKYNNSEWLQKLYTNAFEYALHQNSSLLDNMLDTWEEGDVGPNLGVMIANIPSSALKTFTATVRGVTNPYDTLKGLATLVGTEEGRQILAERYGGWDAIARTMEEDPVGLASDITSITGNVGKVGGFAMAPVKMTKKAIKNLKSARKGEAPTPSNEPLSLGEKIYNIGETIDNISDAGLSLKTSQGINSAITSLTQPGSGRFSRTAGRYLQLTQQPLQSIFKAGSKLYNSFGSSDKSTDGIVGRITSNIRNRYDQFASGLTSEEQARFQNNPYAKEEWEKMKESIDNSGMPMDGQRLTEDGYQRIGDELKARIEAYEKNLSENGAMYEGLRNNPTRYDLSEGIRQIKDFFKEEGIIEIDGDLIFKHGTKEEQAKIKEAWNNIKRNGVANSDFNTYHRVRQDIDNMAKYNEGVNVKNYKSVRKMREILDNVAKKQIPGLEKIDNIYKKEITELNEIKQGLVYKGGDQKGNFRDNFYSIMRTLNKQNRQAMKGRLEEQIFPGISERVEAVDMASKLAKAYQDSPQLMKVFGKALSVGGLAGGRFSGGLSFLVGVIMDELLFKPRGESMRKGAIERITKEMTPEAKQKLVDISLKLKQGIELKEADKLILQSAAEEIKEAMEVEQKRVEQEKIKKEEQRKQMEEKRIKEEEENKRKQEDLEQFITDIDKSRKEIENDEIRYQELSDETLNELRDDESIPQKERDQIEKILRERAQFDEVDYQAEHEKSPVYNLTRRDYIEKIRKLKEEEQRIGKVGKNKVNKEYAEKQRNEREKKRERVIEMLMEDYATTDHPQEEAYDLYLELESQPLRNEEYSKRGGIKQKDKTKEQPILDKLNQKREVWKTTPEFIRNLKENGETTREYYTNLLDGYEIQPVDKGDRVVKDGETVGNITYNNDGTPKEVVVKDLDAFIKQKKLLSQLPDDTQIRGAGDTSGTTAKDFRERTGVEKVEPKYQRAYHGGPNSFDRFALHHMGEGEGLQAHGYGHYVTLDKEVARHYAEKGGTGYYKYKGDDLGFDPDDMEMVNGEGKIAYYMVNDLEHGKSFDEAKKENMEWIEREMEDADDEYIYQLEEMKDALKNMKKSDFSKTSRNFYEIEIPDEVKKNTPTGTNYLHEDKPLTASERDKIVNLFEEKYSKSWENFPGRGKDGRYLYQTLKTLLKSDKKASEFLNSIGYDGIKYDGKQDGPCAVLFTDEAMQIVNHEMYQKYGVANQNDKDIKAQEGLSMENFKNGRTVEQIAKDYGIETNIVDRIATPEGERALGMYADGLITLAKDIKEGTAPHELLHAVFDLVDDKRKKQVLELVKKKLEREGGLENSKDKNLDAEEWLADKFSEYFRTGKFEERGRPKGIKNKIVEFFKRVKDFITGVYKEKKVIKNLFDDIIENRIEQDMVDEVFGGIKNEEGRGTSIKDHQRQYQTAVNSSSRRYITINNGNSSQFTTNLDNLKNKVVQGQITPKNFLQELKNVINNTGKDSEYALIKNGNGKQALRLSDHMSSGYNFMKEMKSKNDNTSLVFKVVANPNRADGTKDQYKPYNGATVQEFVYDIPSLTKTDMIGAIEGIKDLIDKGVYTDTHYTLKQGSVRKYQVTQKSLFDDDLTQPKEEVKGTPKTEETKKKELTDEEVGKVLDTFLKHNLDAWQDFSKNPYKNKTNFTRYGAMKPHREEIKALMGNGEITEEQVNKYSEDRKHFYLKSFVHDIAKTINHLIGDNDTPFSDVRRRKEMFQTKMEVANLPQRYQGETIGKFYETIGKLYDNDVDKRYDKVQEEANRIKDDIPTSTNSQEFKDLYDTALPYLHLVTKQDLTNMQAYLKINQNIKESEIPSDFKKYNGDYLLEGYLENKKQGGQDVKDRVNKLVAIAGGNIEKLQGNLKNFGGKRPMPSIAVTRGEINPRDFGEIMYVFKKDTVDPKVNSDNKLYGSDAYTPMFPADSVYSKKTVDYDDLSLMNGISEQIYFSILRENRNQITDAQARDITEKIVGQLRDDKATTEKEIQKSIEEGLKYWKLLEEPDNAEFITANANLKDNIFDLLQEEGAFNEQSFIRGTEYADGRDRPLTPENVLRAMKEGQKEASWSAKEGSFKDMINIIGTKADDIERARTKNFANVGAHADIPELTEPLQKHYDYLMDAIEQKFDIENPRLDIKKAYDSDVQTFKKNLEKINKGYKKVPDDLLSAMIDTVEEGRNIPIRYMESKPHRLVDMYNEIEYLLVPQGQEDKVLEIVKGTPLEDKIHPYENDRWYTTDKQTHKGVAKTLNELQKKYGNVFFSLGGVIFPITALMGMMGEDEEGQEA